ncbi:MAG TPA: CHAP domain-containing protein [Candidatus Dormibacteraeota bacterium]|nr:CHAP domain-containing protein [Candidatus Dormibacteraeota bacterium]
MKLSSVDVEIRQGFVVAARDEGGLRWTAGRPRRVATGRPTPRVLSHLLVMAAVAAPLVFTAASAHSASPAGRVDGRLTLLVAEQAAQGDHMLMRMSVPARTPDPLPSVPPAAPPAPPAPAVGGGGHFSFGWCTWYVSTKRYVPWMGNAIEWLRNAGAMGYPEGQTPRVGAIMVTRESGWGHVAYVESVDANGHGWTVSEMNYRGFGVVDRRHVSPGQLPLVGFIY